MLCVVVVLIYVYKLLLSTVCGKSTSVSGEKQHEVSESSESLLGMAGKNDFWLNGPRVLKTRTQAQNPYTTEAAALEAEEEEARARAYERLSRPEI